MTNIQISKTAGVDKFSDRFLKDGINILEKPIAALCNLTGSLPKCLPMFSKLRN